MRTRNLAVAAVLGLVLCLVLATPASAQQGEVPGVAFSGCWAPVDGVSSRDRLCIAPTGDGALAHMAITADGQVTESKLSLDGRRITVKTEDCNGWEEGRLTSDRERLIVSSEVTCGREPQQMRETAFTILANGNLLVATGSGLSQVARAQVRIYAPIETYASIPPAVREALMPYLVSAERERLGIRDHAVSAKDLVEFEQLGVAPAIIDLMVAASYPKSFVLDGGGGVLGTGSTVANSARALNPSYVNGYPIMSMYDWELMRECYRTGFGCPIGMYGYSGYGYGYGYGYGGYGLGYPWGGWGYNPGYGVPVIVRPIDPTPSGPGGRAVRGRGYTQNGDEGTGSTAQPRHATTSSSSSSANGSSSSGSAGSSGSSGSSSSGSTARTAKPRP